MPSKKKKEPFVGDFTITEDGDWLPLAVDSKERPYLARCEYAKSSRAKCRLCCQPIEKAQVKIGLPMKWQGGKNVMAAPYGWGTSWAHPHCVRVKSPGDRKALEKMIYNFDNISTKDRLYVLKEISKTDTPESLKEFRPDDEDFNMPAREIKPHEQPAELTRDLLPFQKEGLGWMLEQEERHVKGGILADEMGMGKTIQTIAMLVASKMKNIKAKKQKETTLIILPTSALMQWAEEINSFVKDGTLSVFVYYGDRENVTKEDLEKHDIVLTTYPIVEIEYRKVCDTAKVPCEFCGKMLLPRTLWVHQRYFCGPEAVKTERLLKREKKQQDINEKAMVTLRIKSKESIPTITNVYKELMAEANRAPITMFTKGSGNKSSKGKGRAETKPSLKSEMGLKQEDEDFKIGSPSKRLRRGSNSGVSKHVNEKSVKETPEKVSLNTRRITRSRMKQNNEVNEKGKTPRSSPGKKIKSEREEEYVPDSDEEVVAVGKKDFPRSKRKRNSPTSVLKQDSDQEYIPDSEEELSIKEEPQTLKKSKKKALSHGKGKEVLKEWEQKLKDAASNAHTYKDQEQMLKENSLLHGMKWDRLILDEAHKIKARTTSVAKSIYSLSSAKKWCLTGTPLQNRVGELYSLLRFLELDPYAFYFCRKKDCDCKSLHWRFGPQNKACECCGHPSLYHYSYFNRTILNPITRFGYLGEGKAAVMTLRKVLNDTQLRRTKKGRAEDVKLPELTVTVSKGYLDEKEKDFYESLYKETQVKFDAYVRRGTLLHNYAHIFELLSRLRQTVNHPFLVIHGIDADKGKTETAAASLSTLEQPVALCGICQEQVTPEDVVTGGCGHEFHRTCMMEYVQGLPAGGKLKCPVCFQKLTIDLEESEEQVNLETLNEVKPKKRSILSKIDTKNFVTSSKIEALVKSVLEMRASGDEHKGIIFSQYTRMLDIVEWRIQKLGIKAVKMVGSMPIMMRRSMLEAFRKDDSIKLLLLSLKAGGEGLNLQIASHVFVLEPWWNPAVEMQAIQRAHRIGQTKPVKAVRFLTMDTIEERMMQLQEKKRLVFEGTIDCKVEALTRLTEEDIRFLFS